MISFFHKIVDVLDKSNIPYMLSGSVAMGVYIVPRATRDFDFVVYLQPKDVDNFVSNFQEGYYCNADAVKDAVKRHSLFNIIDHSSGYKADFVILKNEDYRQLEFKRRVKMEYFDKTIYLLNFRSRITPKITQLVFFQRIETENLILLNFLSHPDF